MGGKSTETQHRKAVEVPTTVLERWLRMWGQHWTSQGLYTGGDLSVYVPRDKILFMSEAYLNRVFPAMRSAYPSEWVKTLDRALAMDVDIYVPGHGFVEQAQASREELVEFQKALKYVISEVQRLHKLGLSPEEARKQANWGPYKEWMLADQQDAIAIRKVYEEIEGNLK